MIEYYTNLLIRAVENCYIGKEENDIHNSLNLEVQKYEEDLEHVFIVCNITLDKFVKDINYYDKIIKLNLKLQKELSCDSEINFDKAIIKAKITMKRISNET